MTASTRNRPTNFLFVNKDIASARLSKSEGEVTSAIFRHVQEHIRTGRTVSVPPRSKHKSSKKSKYSAANTITSGQTIESVSTPPSRSDEERSVQDSRSIELGQSSANPSELSTFGNEDKKLTGWHGKRDVSPYLQYPGAGEFLSLPLFIFPTIEAVDPFDSTPVQITRNVHQLLTFFESMFFSNTATQPSSLSYSSASRDVIKDCIFDEVQLKCLLASLASRREIFDHQRISGGATWYIRQAVIALQKRLKTSQTIDHKLMYAMMKLYVAEAYQSNAEAALTHLNGAQTAYNQIGTWHDFDTSYTPTLCASGEAYFLQRVWKTPTVFPTLADPGSATICFSPDLMQQYLLDSEHPEYAAQKLLSELSEYADLLGTTMTLQDIIADILEFSSVRQTMLMREHLELPMPVFVSQWAHLRRFALVFRLMSVSIINDDFLHSVRVSLVLWLQLIANYSGFDQSSQIVARHLRDVVEQVLLSHTVAFSAVKTWVCLIGASTGDQDTRKWFVSQLSRDSMGFDPACSMSMDDLRKLLVGASQGCLYCELLQRQRHLDIARDVFSTRLQQQTWSAE